MMEFSYIVPVYNAESTLERCVESIEYGKRKDIEIILSDDCSTDDSWEICQKMQRRFKNVVCLRNTENKGVSYTRNQALNIARGKYILFVDSDDWVCMDYADSLKRLTESEPTGLALCGFRFRQGLYGNKTDYVFDTDGQEKVVIPVSESFTVLKRVLLQQLWNKIFCGDVIRGKKLRFDESQSMGEDFQFVLDYMEAAQCNKYVIINKPLYTYVRANQSSLMSKFGLGNYEQGLNRYKQLFFLSGGDSEYVQKEYDNACQRLKQTFLYQITHTSALKKTEKLRYIEQVQHDGQALKYYRNGTTGFYKEQLRHMKQLAQNWINGFSRRIQRNKNAALTRKIKEGLKQEQFSLISQNCIGGLFYHDMGLQFQSPTINLFFSAEDFLKFAANLKYYMRLELDMYWGPDYPMGRLGDLVIHFMHYLTCREAKDAWERRSMRLQYDKIVIISTDRNNFGIDEFMGWKNLPYKKILFTANSKFAGEEGVVFYPEYEKKGLVPDLIPKREFYKDGILLSVINSL